MREMKDSGVQWIGEMPLNWMTMRVKNVASKMQSGGTPDSSNDGFYVEKEKGIPWVTIADMSTVSYVTDTGRYISEEAQKSKNLIILQPGTILYAMYASVGKVAELSIPATINQALLAIELNTSVNGDFFKYALMAWEPYIISESSGTTQFNLNANKVANLRFPAPNVCAQKHIACFLNAKLGQANTLIANVQAQIQKLKDYKQSLITEVVTKGLRSTAPMKDSGIEWIGQIPEHWDMTKKLAFVTTDGISYGIVKLYDPDDVNGVKVLRCSDVLEGFIKPDNIRTVTREVSNEYARTILAGGEVLVNVRGSLGGCAVVPEEMAGYNIAREVAKITLNSRMCNRYVMYYLLSRCFVEYRTSHLSGSVYVGLNIELLSSCPLPNPELTEQKAIADYLDKKCSQIDHLIAIKQAKIERLEQYKRSLIYEYVTGKREVM